MHKRIGSVVAVQKQEVNITQLVFISLNVVPLLLNSPVFPALTWDLFLKPFWKTCLMPVKPSEVFRAGVMCAGFKEGQVLDRGDGRAGHSSGFGHSRQEDQVVSCTWAGVLGQSSLLHPSLPLYTLTFPPFFCSSCTCLGRVQPKLLRSALLKITLQIKTWVRFLQCEVYAGSFSAATDKPDRKVITSHSYLTLLFTIISFNPFDTHHNNVNLNEFIWY